MRQSISEGFLTLLINVGGHGLLDISPKEISHSIKDRFASVDFDRPQVMNARCNKCVGTCIDCLMRQVLHEVGGHIVEVILRFWFRDGGRLMGVDAGYQKV